MCAQRVVPEGASEVSLTIDQKDCEYLQGFAQIASVDVGHGEALFSDDFPCDRCAGPMEADVSEMLAHDVDEIVGAHVEATSPKTLFSPTRTVYDHTCQFRTICIATIKALVVIAKPYLGINFHDRVLRPRQAHANAEGPANLYRSVVAKHGSTYPDSVSVLHGNVGRCRMLLMLDAPNCFAEV